MGSCPEYSFSHIIHADHQRINHQAGRIRRLLQPKHLPTPSATPTPIIISNQHTRETDPDQVYDTTRHQSRSTMEHEPTIKEVRDHLLEITCSLIRHDFSESIVMRPAFLSHFGPKIGQEMVDRDIQDHNAGRNALLNLLSELDRFRSQRDQDNHLNRDSTGQYDGTAGRGKVDEEVELSEAQVEILRGEITGIFDEFGEHMTVESGQFIPRFESEISTEMSRRLGREYADTLVMVPDLSLPTLSGNDREQRERVFSDRLEYILCSDSVGIYKKLLQERKKDDGYFEKLMRREVDRLQRHGKIAKL